MAEAILTSRRGKGRQVGRVLMSQAAVFFRQQRKERLAVLRAKDQAATADTQLAARLETWGYKRSCAPSPRAAAIDARAYEDYPCDSCEAAQQAVMPFMAGSDYVLVLECLRCGHQAIA